ncbi:MAG: hypothetical protein ACM3ML_20315 [Micromonosporaceae bacterium]
MVAVSAACSYVLLSRSASWYPWLRVLVVAAGAVAVIGVLAEPSVTRLAAVQTPPGGLPGGQGLPGGLPGGGTVPGSAGGTRGPQGGGLGGGLGGAAQVSSTMVALLKSGASGYRWPAAIVGASAQSRSRRGWSRTSAPARSAGTPSTTCRPRPPRHEPRPPVLALGSRRVTP